MPDQTNFDRMSAAEIAALISGDASSAAEAAQLLADHDKQD